MSMPCCVIGQTSSMMVIVHLVSLNQVTEYGPTNTVTVLYCLQLLGFIFHFHLNLNKPRRLVTHKSPAGTTTFIRRPKQNCHLFAYTMFHLASLDSFWIVILGFICFCNTLTISVTIATAIFMRLRYKMMLIISTLPPVQVSSS